jgi:hypothetical protein
MHSSEGAKTPVFTKNNVNHVSSINSQADFASEVSIMDIEKGEFISSYRNSAKEVINEQDEIVQETNIFSSQADSALQSGDLSNAIVGQMTVEKDI